MPVQASNGGLNWKAGIDTSQLKKDAGKVEDILGDLRKKQADEEGKLLKKIKNQHRETYQDGLRAFQQLTPEMQKNINILQSFETELKQVGLAQRQLDADFKAGEISMSDYNKITAGLTVRTEELTQNIYEYSAAMKNASASASKGVKAQTRQWNGLGNSINQISRELPAFTYSAQTGFLAISNNIPILADEISRLRDVNQRLVASGQKGIPVWRQILKGLLSWQTALSLGVTLLTIYGKEIADWVQGLFKGKQALDQVTVSHENMAKAFQSTDFKSGIKSFETLRSRVDLARKGVIDSKKVVDEFNGSLRDTADRVTTLDEVEGFITKNAQAYIKMTLAKAAAQEALNSAVEAASEQQKAQNTESDEYVSSMERFLNALGRSATPGTAGNDQITRANEELKKTGEDNRRQAIEEAKKNKDAFLKIYNDKLEEYERIAEQIGFDPLGERAGQLAKEAEKRRQRELVTVNDERFQEETKRLKEELVKQTDLVVEFEKRKSEIGLQAVNNAGSKALNLQRDFYRRTEQLTVEAARVLLQKAENELDTSTVTDKRKEELRVFISDLNREINKIQLDDLFKFGVALGNLGRSLTDLGNVSRSAGLAQIGGLLSGLASGVNDVLVAFDKEARDSDKIVAGVNGLIRVIDTLSSAAAQRKKAEEDYYRAVIGFQQDYNLSLHEQIRLQSILNESAFLTDYEGRIKDGLAAIKDANSEYQDALRDLVGGSVKSGQRNAVDLGNVGSAAAGGAALGAAVGSIIPVLGTAIGGLIGGVAGAISGLFGGKKKVDNYVPLLQEYPELIKDMGNGMLEVNEELARSLMQNDLLNDSTKQLVQNVLDWDKALEEAREQVKGVIDDLAGSLGNDLRNDLVEAFQAGENAAKKMGDTVEDVLQNIVSQLAFNQIFADNFQALEDEMAKSMDIGGDQSWTDDLGRFFRGFSSEVGDFNKVLEDARKEAEKYGFDILGNTGSNQQGLTRQVQSLTEDTGNELAGLFRGYYDLQKENNNTAFNHLKTANDQLMELHRIEYNTRVNIAKWDQAIPIFQAIQKNTKNGSQNNRDLGID